MTLMIISDSCVYNYSESLRRANTAYSKFTRLMEIDGKFELVAFCWRKDNLVSERKVPDSASYIYRAHKVAMQNSIRKSLTESESIATLLKFIHFIEEKFHAKGIFGSSRCT